MKTSPAYFSVTDTDGEDVFVIELTDPILIDHARRVLRGEETSKVHIQGTIVQARAPYNQHWSFHLDPDTIKFFELAIEVCDASIAFVEENLCQIGGSTLPNRHWCPWTSRLTSEVFFHPPFQRYPFAIGNPYILIGRGGGFTQQFTDFIIGQTGQTTIVNYTRDYNGTPLDLRSAPLLTYNLAEDFEKFLSLAVQINFFNIQLPPPMSEMVERLFISHPTYGDHEVVWSDRGDPIPPDDLLKLAAELRRFLAESFTREFGS